MTIQAQQSESPESIEAGARAMWFSAVQRLRTEPKLRKVPWYKRWRERPIDLAKIMPVVRRRADIIAAIGQGRPPDWESLPLDDVRHLAIISAAIRIETQRMEREHGAAAFDCTPAQFARVIEMAQSIYDRAMLTLGLRDKAMSAEVVAAIRDARKRK